QIRERYFREIIQNIGVGVVVYNDKGFVTEVNPAALDLFGLNTFTHLLQLERVDAQFRAELLSLTNQCKKVILLRKPNEQVQIVTRCSVINLKDEEMKLVTLQDIRGELERKELDSWVKLIRVLSHEIMNSLAPVTSIAQSLKGIWNEKKKTVTMLPDEAVESTLRGLEVIGERGEGLIRFVNSYRMLTRIPTPHFASVDMSGLFDRLSILVSPLKTDYRVPILFVNPDPDFPVTIDEQLMVQVIINLVKNAAEALKSTPNPQIEVTCRKKAGGENEISVCDNGPGIAEEISEEIFVPFFTTKDGGTGVGLSHSRQIVKLHGGSIHFQSRPGKTTFFVVF
ncbi:MAG TPA: ATP-binding protein, partial [Prolixibacteraceae bacterium]|nr:ATP-binding protein [Prolixibacteraceae bacterium]